MKGQTNAQAGVTVKTGVTVDMIKNISEDMPWDLTYDSSDYSIILHDIGPVTTTAKAIIGARYDSTSYAHILKSIKAESDRIIISGTRTNGSSHGGTSINLTDSELASAKLYLYGGGL